MRRILITFLAVAWTAGLAAAQTPRDQKVRNDRQKVEAEGFWIYNDLPRGIAEAKKTGKPLLVIMRCIPCDECVKLDDDLVNRDPHVRPLLEKYVCVRVVATNGLDLSLFQFDYDQSFAAFLLNADGAIYGRFGTRSHRTVWAEDVSVEGLAKALQGGLDLHAAYPANKDALALKRGPAPDYASPEKFPSLKSKYTATLNYQGNVVASCIHCHQIGDAQKEIARKSGKPMPEAELFPYPHPKSQGLILDPKERATVRTVVEGSSAAKAGFKAGDEIVTLEGQPPLSLADLQWVLHRADAGGATLKAVVRRDGKSVELAWTLPTGWRRSDDISWRSSSWGLRRMAFGGMLLEEMTDKERKAVGVAEGQLALRVKHVGEYGLHAAAKNAGVRKGDVVVGFDGKSDLRRETDLLIHGLTALKPGETVAVALRRDGKTITVKVPTQE